MKITIIGSGFVGTAIGKGLKALGNEVIFYDVVDKDRPNFTFLNRGKLYFINKIVN